jgi:hypothetical protein
MTNYAQSENMFQTFWIQLSNALSCVWKYFSIKNTFYILYLIFTSLHYNHEKISKNIYIFNVFHEKKNLESIFEEQKLPESFMITTLFCFLFVIIFINI